MFDMSCRGAKCSRASDLCGSGSGRAGLDTSSQHHSKRRSGGRQLTRNARKQLPSEALDLAVGEGHEAVAFEKVKDTLAKEVHDDANVSTVVEAVPQVDASIPIILIICLQSGEYPEFDSRGITVFLHRSDNLNRDELVTSPVTGLDNLAESALAKQAHDLV